MPAPNYYQLLELPANADSKAIKKSFRRLAHQYHPDKNDNNELRGKRFLLIQEAYETLNDPKRKQVYDTELWLSLKKFNKSNKPVQPAAMVQKIEKLSLDLEEVKKYSLLEDEKTALLLDALNEEYVLIFLSSANEEEIERYTKAILKVAKTLPKRFRNLVFSRLLDTFSSTNLELNKEIEFINENKKNSDWYQKYQIWILIAISTLLCVLMFLYGKK